MGENNMLQDRMVFGAIAGMAGAVVQNFYAVIAESMGLTGPVYLNYGKIVLMLKDYNDPLADTLGVIGHFTWDIILGIAFAYLVSLTSSRYYILKGIIYGIIVWYFIKVIATLFKIPVIIGVQPHTVAFFFIGAILYGATLALTLKLLDSRKIKV